MLNSLATNCMGNENVNRLISMRKEDLDCAWSCEQAVVDQLHTVVVVLCSVC
jgi:hypothetical protein